MVTSELSPPTGVLAENFTEEVWEGVATAYIRSAYNVPETEDIEQSRWHYISADDIKSGYDEYRFGSLITMHSKLLVCPRTLNPRTYHFDFYANAEKYEIAYAARQGITPEGIKNDFRTRVATFLTELGIAREVTCCE